MMSEPHTTHTRRLLQPLENMGIENRDYFRKSSNRGAAGDWGIDSIPPICKGLIAANVVVFLLQIFTTRVLSPEELQERLRPWNQGTAQSSESDHGRRAAGAGLPARLVAITRLPTAAETDADGNGNKHLDAAEASQPEESAHRSPEDGRHPRSLRRRGPDPEDEGLEEDFDGSEFDPRAYALHDFPRVSVVEEWLQLDTPAVLRGQIWRLVTNAFCHDRFSVWHIVLNMLFLFWFGVTLERMYGSREFLLFYLAAAVVASVAYIAVELITRDVHPAIGASGAIMGVTMLYAIHYPRHIIYVCFVIPVEVRWIVLLYVIYDLHPVLLALTGHRVVTGVAHAAHLGGLAFGFVYWRQGLRLEPMWNWFARRWSRGRSRTAGQGQRPALRVYQPARDSDARPDEDSELDSVLRKLHQHGEASLTDQERATLRAASERYQRRNTE